MSAHSAKRVESLPKWAQNHIADLENRVRRAEATLPWTQPGMEWFLLLHPDTRLKNGEHVTLFTCTSAGTNPVCSVGPDDCVFVGRGKKEGS